MGRGKNRLMEDEWIAFLRRKQEHYRTSIELLKAGRNRTSQMQDGVMRDTTADAIADNERWLAEIDALLEKIGG